MKKFNYCSENMARFLYRKSVNDDISMDRIADFFTCEGYCDLVDWFIDFHHDNMLDWYLGGYYE